MKVKEMKKLILAATALSVVTAPVYAHTIQPVAGSQMLIEYDRGEATITSEQPTTRVLISPAQSHKENQRLVFNVAVFNDGQTPINFSPELLGVTLNGVPLARISEEQLIKEQKNRAGWAAFGAAMVTGLAAAAVATDYNTVTYRDNRGYASKMTYKSRNTGAEVAVLAGGAVVQHELSQVHEAEKARIADVSAKMQTIHPQTVYQFEVEFDMPKKLPNKGIGQVAEFTIQTGSEYHEFDVTVIKEKKD